MRIAVIGAGRRHNGIGSYIARFASAAGARVVAVLGQDTEAARQDAEALRLYGINPEPYVDLGELIGQQAPEALVIASPAVTHAGYLSSAIDAGVHVLCEKPFVWDNGCDCSMAERLLSAARAKCLTVAMNSQWPFIIPAYERLCGLPPAGRIHSFRIELSPLSAGRDMVPDSVPHALSLLYSVLGPGRLENLVLDPGPDRLSVYFDYLTEAVCCRSEAHLVRSQRQPRPFAFGFNGMIARRTIDMDTYGIAFTSEGRRIDADDPLRCSVNDFLNTCGRPDHPLIGPEHILATTRMLQQVYASWPQQRPHNQEMSSGKTSRQGA